MSTGEPGAPPVDEVVEVVREAALTVDVEGVESYTLMCTPTDTEELAAGFLLSEGIIEGMDEVRSLRPCKDDPLVIRVRLAGGVPGIGEPGRNLMIVSSCGLCGSQDLEEKLRGLPRVGDTLRVGGALLRAAVARLPQGQVLFSASGGTHAAAIFDDRGDLLWVAEDVGRHNALDKAVGRCLRSGRRTAGCGVVLSGRVSVEMVGKCARAGLELISAVSAPTSLAIAVAERCGITLCAFVRETRATLFTHPHRVVDDRR
jgi:FdhD protein